MILAVFISSVKDSLSRNDSDGAIRDEALTSAIPKVRSAADEPLQANESLTEDVNTAMIFNCLEILQY